MEKNNFRFSIGDDPEHEELTAEIYFEEKFVAIISQEKGFEEMKIEIFQKSNGKPWAFQLNEFLEIIELSKRRLWELRRI